MQTEPLLEKKMSFEEFGLRPEILRAVAEKKYTIPTPIQEKAIPIVLEGKDLVGCAQTGTGKTAAFALPILHRLQGTPWKGTGRRPIRVLVLTPTRELASQIAESFGAYGKHTALKQAHVFAGVNQGPEAQAPRRGVSARRAAAALRRTGAPPPVCPGTSEARLGQCRRRACSRRRRATRHSFRRQR